MGFKDLLAPRSILDSHGKISDYYKAVTCDEFVSMEIPPQEFVLNPWLPKQGLAMVFAERGIGKTFFALEVGLTVAMGAEFLNWRAPATRNVLYLDGEMQMNLLQERINQLVKHHGGWSPRNLALIPCGMQANGVPDLSTPQSQQRLRPHLEKADLIIVDNISTLCRTGVENEAESWIPVQNWLLRLRAEGKTVLLIHHAGKGGTQRGTSKREDVLDTVIQLKRPESYTADQGARFELNFLKARSFAGEEARPQIVQLTDGPNGLEWQSDAPESTSFEKVVELLNTGMSQADIARKIGLSTTQVSRHANNARQRGLIINTD